MTAFEAELPEALAGERLDRVVAMLCDLPRSVAGELVDAGEVRVDGQVRTRRADRLVEGQRLSLELPDVAEGPAVVADASVEVVVVHEDPHLIVVDKPAGLVVHPGAGNPTGTLVHGLLARYPEMAEVGEPFRPGIVHRLDRDTSGLLVVARTAEAHAGLVDALRHRHVTRRYRTLVWDLVTEPRGQVDAPIGRSTKDPTRMAVVVGGREARTTYEVVRRFHEPVEATELVCHLETGRTHQIRVHLRAIGHPVVGDPRYGGARQSFAAPRQVLHAEHLAFAHPVTGERVEAHSDLPADLAEVLARLS
ncbi:MAG TPA: RluA family pseudouridine synthase [Acidimicrobiales bacterium]|nr:RluA family pseudouridine synthase [Acidimicrobiales bacterium]